MLLRTYNAVECVPRMEALLNNGDVVNVVGGNRSEGSGSNVISIM